CRGAEPLQRKNKERCGDQIRDFDEGVRAQEGCHCFLGPLDLNIFNMRSVMMKPPTTLLVAAMIAPTTAMASRALVSDINGVCSSGDTRRITSNPMKAASIKTYRPVSRSSFIFSLPLVATKPAGRKIPALWR